MEVKLKKLVPNAFDPIYATEGSACFDLKSLTKGFVLPDRPLAIKTGIAVEIPEGHVMLLFSRSGHGFKSHISMSNCVGIIDSDYRGEIGVQLRCDSPGHGIGVDVGDRIAQGMVIPVDKVQFTVVDELSDTARGTGGYGSTGK